MIQEATQEQGFGITTIDTGFRRPGLVASHLIQQDGRAAFIDVGISHAIPVLLQVLQQKNIKPDQLDYVIVTHVHLDHAGAAGMLMRELPNAMLVVHSRGARHMMDPAKLIAGATAVYGEDEMHAEFGEIIPVAAERVIEATDEYRLDLGGRSLLFLDAPGHARHHYCIYDKQSKGVFTGDTLGLSYSVFDTEQGAFIFPTTTPVQFDPEALHQSINRIMEYAPARFYLAHYGCVTGTTQLAAQMHKHIDRFVEIANHAEKEQGDRSSLIKSSLTEYLFTCLRQHGCTLDKEVILTIMDMDLELNTQGLVCWLDCKTEKR